VIVLPAHLVATPVLERLPLSGAGGAVLGASATAAWVDLGGFVLAVTTREVPLLPNAVALAADAGALGRVAHPGGAARCGPGRVELGGLTVTWDPAAPPAWDPTVPVALGVGRPASVGRRGEAVLAALGVRAAREPVGLDPRGARKPLGLDAGGAREPVELVAELARVGLATAAEPEGAAGVELLLRALLDRDPDVAATAAAVLLGRGPGLTPEGDDLLAAVAATLVTLGPAAGLAGASLAGLLAALVPERAAGGGPGPGGAGAPAGRTTALAATLLELAARGQVVEPAGRLLDLSPAGELAWPGALRRLERLGHGSGRAYALGIGAAAWLLAAGGAVG
jgi:hypothetical protein